MTRFNTAAALAALSLFSVGAAHAQSDIMVVRVSDLNVSSSHGAEVALRRIKNASALFCGDSYQRDFIQTAEKQKCVTRMTNKAIDSLNAPMVTALYRGPNAVELASRGPR